MVGLKRSFVKNATVNAVQAKLVFGRGENLALAADASSDRCDHCELMLTHCLDIARTEQATVSNRLLYLSDIQKSVLDTVILRTMRYENLPF
jgi:hypothetical protein